METVFELLIQFIMFHLIVMAASPDGFKAPETATKPPDRQQCVDRPISHRRKQSDTSQRQTLVRYRQPG